MWRASNVSKLANRIPSDRVLSVITVISDIERSSFFFLNSRTGDRRGRCESNAWTENSLDCRGQGDQHAKKERRKSERKTAKGRGMGRSLSFIQAAQWIRNWPIIVSLRCAKEHVCRWNGVDVIRFSKGDQWSGKTRIFWEKKSRSAIFPSHSDENRCK